MLILIVSFGRFFEDEDDDEDDSIPGEWPLRATRFARRNSRSIGRNPGILASTPRV
jgi:hypothetical protein